MKRIVLVITNITLLLTLASVGETWEINVVENNPRTGGCLKTVTLCADGEHLFWRQQDCSVTLSPGQTGKCVLPGGICPTKFYIKDTQTGQIEWSQDYNFASCQNKNIELRSHPEGKCGFFIYP